MLGTLTEARERASRFSGQAGDLKRQTAKSQAEFLAEWSPDGGNDRGSQAVFCAGKQAQDWLRSRPGEALFQKKEEKPAPAGTVPERPGTERNAGNRNFKSFRGSLRGSGEDLQSAAGKKTEKKTQQEGKKLFQLQRAAGQQTEALFGSALETRKEIMEWFSAQLVEAEQKKEENERRQKRLQRLQGRACALPAGDRTVPQERCRSTKKDRDCQKSSGRISGESEESLKKQAEEANRELAELQKTAAPKQKKSGKKRKSSKGMQGSWKKKKTPARMQYKGFCRFWQEPVQSRTLWQNSRKRRRKSLREREEALLQRIRC